MAFYTDKLDSWAPQNLSSVFWSLVVLKEEHCVAEVLPTFMPAIVAEVTRRLRDLSLGLETQFSHQDLANYVSFSSIWLCLSMFCGYYCLILRSSLLTPLNVSLMIMPGLGPG